MNDHERNKHGPGVSRRAFLKGTGLSAATTALTGPSAQALAGPADVKKTQAVPGFGPAGVKCELLVNGAKLSTQIEPRVTLLDALRNYVDVTGPKRVCDRGTCGACTVIVDGKPIYACTTFALEAQGKSIETAEHLADGKLHAVPAAFAKFDAQQCGFCTPGFVMAMKACLDKNQFATAAEIEEALAGNICRCGTYQQMRDALRSLCTAPEKKGG